MKFVLVLVTVLCATGTAAAQSRFDDEALRFALRGIAPAPAVAQADESWRRVVALVAGTRVTMRLDGGLLLSGEFASADASGVTFTRSGSSTSEVVRREEIVEMYTQRSRRGAIIGAIAGGAAGVFLGVGTALSLGTRDCGGNCTDEKFLIGASLAGIPTAGAWLGYRAFSRGPETIYRRP